MDVGVFSCPHPHDPRNHRQRARNRKIHPSESKILIQWLKPRRGDWSCLYRTFTIRKLIPSTVLGYVSSYALYNHVRRGQVPLCLRIPQRHVSPAWFCGTHVQKTGAEGPRKTGTTRAGAPGSYKDQVACSLLIQQLHFHTPVPRGCLKSSPSSRVSSRPN